MLAFQFIFLSIPSALVAARLITVTVDDQDSSDLSVGSLQYTGAWLKTGIDLCSSNCKADATFRQAYRQTWTKSLFDPNGDSTIKTASILFNGNTISVYCIATSVTDEGFPGNSDMVFLIDGELAGNFQRQRPSSSSPNLLVFRSQSLEMGEHNLTIQNGRLETQQQVVMLLDYIEYTTDDGSSLSAIQTSETETGIPMPSPSATSNSKIHNIALIAVPSVIAFIVLSGLIFTIHRIRRRQVIEPETLPSSRRWDQSKPTHSSHPSSTTSLLVPYPLHQSNIYFRLRVG